MIPRYYKYIQLISIGTIELKDWENIEMTLILGDVQTVLSLHSELDESPNYKIHLLLPITMTYYS